MPMNDCSSFLLTGCGMLVMACTCQVSLKNATCVFLYYNFSKFSFTLFSQAVWSSLVNAVS